MSIGQLVAAYSPGRPSEYFSWREALAPVVEESISDCAESYAQSDDIVIGMPSSSV